MENTSNGSTAMMIEGARRAGKSYVSELFGKREYKYIIYTKDYSKKEI